MEEVDKSVVIVKDSGLCRCCLSEGCYRHLTSEYPWLPETEVYADMLLQCFDIKLSHHPDVEKYLICEVCIARIRDANQFKKQVQDCELKFVNMLLVGQRIQDKVESYIQECEVEPQLNCELIIKEELVDIQLGGQENLEGQEVSTPDFDSSYNSFTNDGLFSEQSLTDTSHRFSCPICSKTFLKKRYMKKHYDNHNGAKIFECPICKKSFNSKSNLKRHSVIHGESKPFDCYICNKKFTQKCILTRHLLTHNEYRRFQCDSCDKKFYNMVELTQHLQIHSAVFKEFICDMCSKKFAKKDHLIRHLTIHNSFRPYACDVCKRRFNQKGQLQRHCLKNHSGKLFICGVCDIKFDAWFELSRHFRDVHRQRTFPCSMCDKSFTNRYNLKRHSHIHSGERPFSCDVCKKTFNRKCHWTAHMFKHSGDKPFACEVCHKKFSMKHHVLAHLATHTTSNKDNLVIKSETKSENTQTPTYPIEENVPSHIHQTECNFVSIKVENV